MYRQRIGVVFQSRVAIGSRERCRFQWTSDAAGDVVARVDVDLSGIAESVEFSNSDAGSETYSVTLIDDLGLDWLLGLGGSKSTAATTRAAFVEETVTSAESRPAPLPGSLWLKVDCSASAVRSGIVDIWLRAA